MGGEGCSLGRYHWGSCGDFKNECFLLTLSYADVEVGQAGDSALVPTLQRWQAASGLRPHRARVLALERVWGEARTLQAPGNSLFFPDGDGVQPRVLAVQGEVSAVGTARGASWVASLLLS